jgi:hypothetical protein
MSRCRDEGINGESIAFNTVCECLTKFILSSLDII